MHITVPLTSAILLAISCTSVWSQPNQAIARDGSDDLLRPRMELYDWRAPTAPPKLSCPDGASQERRIIDKTWQTWCARDGQRHGPFQSFDLRSREHVDAEYVEGVRHGWAIRVRVHPTVELRNHGRNAQQWRFDQIERLSALTEELSDWLPRATPPPLRCPEGARSHRAWITPEVWKVECRLPDGSQHGPYRQMEVSYGREIREFYRYGKVVGTRVTIEDQRTSEESLYDRGRLIRRLHWTSTGLQMLETRRRDTRVIVRFHAGGEPASMVRFKGDVRNGESLAWHDNGQLAERAEYRAGAVSGAVKKWDAKGNLIEVRRLVAGTGEVERINPGRDNERTLCVHRQGQIVSCKTTDAKGGLLDESAYVDGHLHERKSWWSAGGALRSHYVRSPDNPEHAVQRNYERDGHVSQRSECWGSRCTTTRHDRDGKAEVVYPRGLPARNKLHRLLGDML